jgi:hypothetical protein
MHPATPAIRKSTMKKAAERSDTVYHLSLFVDGKLIQGAAKA